MATEPKLKALQAHMQQRLASNRAARARQPLSPEPRYDEVFVRGTAWLDRLAESDERVGEAPIENQPTTVAAHQLCRPPPDAVDTLRLGEDGEWRSDDGSPGLAFSYRILTCVTGGPPMASAVRCRCGAASCPDILAMAKTRERWGLANGRAVPPIPE